MKQKRFYTASLLVLQDKFFLAKPLLFLTKLPFFLVVFFCCAMHNAPAQTNADPSPGAAENRVPVRVVESSAKLLAFRLSPGMDLKEELERIVSERGIKAASVLTCVGSLRDAVVRFANKPSGTGIRGPLEIVSLTGTLGSEGSSHLHIALSDGEGRTIGGHVLTGCRIFTTAEIVLAILPGAVFTRELDTLSGYKELSVKPQK